MATKSRLRIPLRPHRNLLEERATLTSRAGPKFLPLPTFAAFSGRPLTFWNSTSKSWRSLCSWWTRTRTSHSWFWDCWSNSSKDVPKHSPTISTRTTTTLTSDVSFSLNGRNLRKTILGVITNTIFLVTNPHNNSKAWVKTQEFCSVLGKTHLDADHHFWVKAKFGIIVESSFIWANQVWPRATTAPKNDRNKKYSH